MAAKRKPEPEVTEGSVPDVLTVSEHSKLTDEDKQAFRVRLGTVTPDPE